MAIKPELVRNLFQRAMEEELGLVVTTNNTPRFVTKWHDLAKGYDQIMICIPSIPNCIFLVKKSVELPE